MQLSAVIIVLADCTHAFELQLLFKERMKGKLRVSSLFDYTQAFEL